MNKQHDLRAILSQNIKTARESLHITKSALADFTGLSISSIVDIERRRTWVSDKTLTNIAKALNMEAYELLIPQDNPKIGGEERETMILHGITDLISQKKAEFQKTTNAAMNDLAQEIIKLYSEG
ncbi:hypothetical protein AGMMS50212_00540 [Spirochaetia bacterium]|nr:hypothetical protein AGMMS50212_00540 [Spirochaetia bacterium]